MRHFILLKRINHVGVFARARDCVSITPPIKLCLQFTRLERTAPECHALLPWPWATTSCLWCTVIISATASLFHSCSYSPRAYFLIVPLHARCLFLCLVPLVGSLFPLKIRNEAIKRGGLIYNPFFTFNHKISGISSEMLGKGYVGHLLAIKCA